MKRRWRGTAFSAVEVISSGAEPPLTVSRRSSTIAVPRKPKSLLDAAGKTKGKAGCGARINLSPARRRICSSPTKKLGRGKLRRLPLSCQNQTLGPMAMRPLPQVMLPHFHNILNAGNNPTILLKNLSRSICTDGQLCQYLPLVNAIILACTGLNAGFTRRA